WLLAHARRRHGGSMSTDSQQACHARRPALRVGVAPVTARGVAAWPAIGDGAVGNIARAGVLDTDAEVSIQELAALGAAEDAALDAGVATAATGAGQDAQAPQQ